jgi:hypothetical protein
MFATVIALISLSAAANAFTIRPGANIVAVQPGRERVASYEISNSQDRSIFIRCETKDAYVLPENHHVSARDWLKPLFKRLEVPAKSSAQATFRINAPKASSGELAAFVSFIPDDAPAKDAAASGMVSIATLVTGSLYVQLSGTEKKDTSIGVVHVRNQPRQGDLPARIEMSAVVKNAGNTHQRPSVHFQVFRDGQKESLAQADVPTGWPVMPYTQENYNSYAPGQLAPGRYRLQTRVRFSAEWELVKDTGFIVNAEGQSENEHDAI